MTAIIRMLRARFIALFCCENVEEGQIAVNAFEAKQRKAKDAVEYDVKTAGFGNTFDSYLYVLNDAIQDLINMKLLHHENRVSQITGQCRHVQNVLIRMSLLFDFDLLTEDEESEGLPGKES
jgi:hypothetical protein